jgi:hypothetical protein
LARLIPTEVSVDQTVTLDLGAAIKAADKRLTTMNADLIAQDLTPVIDVTPEPVRAKPQPELTDPRVLASTPTAEPERWEGYE